MSDITSDDIRNAVQIAGLKNYAGKYSELGGGEINDTFLLECKDQKVVLRIAKYPDQVSLKREADTLRLLNLPEAPRRIFFNESQKIRNKLWIVESYIEGRHVDRLTTRLFRQLGITLARIHGTTLKKAEPVNIWANFLERRKQYGDEEALLNHPDKQLRNLMRRAHSYVKSFQGEHDSLPCSIIHGDATPTNILVDHEKVSLIDWEFSHFNDPMAEFATIYYNDMDYNDGKWRVHITPEEQAALFEGYEAASGQIDEERIQLWMLVDKLGASLYLYWRLNLSGRPTTDEQAKLYMRELEKLVSSLQAKLPIK